MTLLRKLLDRFRGPGYRHAYVDSFLDSYIATQIKVLREQRRLTQTRLAELAGMKQSQISQLEDVNHSSWKISTLKKLARAFDLVLVVRFESFGKVLPDIDTFERDRLERASFNDDPGFAPAIYTTSSTDLRADTLTGNYVRGRESGITTSGASVFRFPGKSAPNAA